MTANHYTRRDFLGRAGATAALLGTGASVLTACGATTSSVSKKSAPMLVGITNDLDTLNPLTTVTTLDTHWLVYDKLMAYDASLNAVLQLARTRKVSPDGRTITFT